MLNIQSEMASTLGRVALLIAVITNPGTQSSNSVTSTSESVAVSMEFSGTASTGSLLISSRPVCSATDLRMACNELNMAQQILSVIDPSDATVEKYLDAVKGILDWADTVDLASEASTLTAALENARAMLVDRTDSYAVWSSVTKLTKPETPLPVPHRFVRPARLNPVQTFDFSARSIVRDLMT